MAGYAPATLYPEREVENMKITDFEHGEYEKISGVRTISHRVSNEYRVDGDVVHVKLRWTKKEAVMMCDLDDWERLKGFTWGVGKSGGYAIANIHVNRRHRTVKFHQIIMGQRKGYLVDHINRNPLDNRKENLRFVTAQANLVNSRIPVTNKSGVKGVSLRKDSGKWRAQITLNGKIYCLGSFASKDEAIKARQAAEEKLFKPLFED